MNVLELAVFWTDNCGASTGVSTVLEQRDACGQPASPPPLTVAVFSSVLPSALASGVTEIVKLTGDPLARPAETVHVTCCPATVQPATVPFICKSLGTLSVTVATDVVAAEPVLVTCNV